MVSAAPVDAIRILIEGIASKNFTSREFIAAVWEVGNWLWSLFGGEEGPLASTAELSDDDAVERLKSLAPEEGQPQAALDPAIFKPLLGYLVQLLMNRILKR